MHFSPGWLCPPKSLYQSLGCQCVALLGGSRTFESRISWEEVRLLWVCSRRGYCYPQPLSVPHFYLPPTTRNKLPLSTTLAVRCCHHRLKCGYCDSWLLRGANHGLECPQPSHEPKYPFLSFRLTVLGIFRETKHWMLQHCINWMKDPWNQIDKFLIPYP